MKKKTTLNIKGARTGNGTFSAPTDKVNINIVGTKKVIAEVKKVKTAIAKLEKALTEITVKIN